jgi:hypothetical protein
MKKISSQLQKVIIVAAAMAATVTAFGQSIAEDIRPGKDATAVSVQGAFIFTSGSSTGLLQGSYGKFLTDNIELELSPIFISSNSGGSTTTIYDIQVTGQYYFSKGRVCPYVNAGLGVVGVSNGGSSASTYVIGAGVEYFQSSKASIFIEADQEQFNTSGSTTSATLVSIGLKFYLGK